MSNLWLKEQTRYVYIGVTLFCVMALKKEVYKCASLVQFLNRNK